VGRWSWSDRNTVEECWSIEISWLKKHGYLEGYQWGTIEWKNWRGEVTGSIGIQSEVNCGLGVDAIKLNYTQKSNRTQEKEELDYKIQLTTMPCNFGAVRYWFICPLVIDGHPCQHRVGKLYLPPNSKLFGCRHCHNLTYRCQKEHNIRVDELLKNPALLLEKMHSGHTGDFLQVSKAMNKINKIK